MAYNPFNIFRRNQKALFAVLTVFIMIMFTLQSGVAGGDFFETIARWLGSTKGEKVCKIDGRTVTTHDLTGGPKSLQFRRSMANRFMFHAAVEAAGNLTTIAGQQREKLSELGRRTADAALGAIEAMEEFNSPRMRALRANPQFAGILEGQYLRQLQGAEQRLELLIEANEAKQEDKDMARHYRNALNLRKLLSELPGDNYFMNAPNRTNADLIEFMLWQKKADQFGIKFSRDDVKRLYQQDLSQAFPEQSETRVRRKMAEMTGYTFEACLDALAEEFRVRAAQVAVLGYTARFYSFRPGQVFGAPALGTPYEAFEYYRDQTSPSTYEVVAVPAAAFVGQVKDQPSDTELRDLFRKGENEEPNPKNENFGFKIPRKVMIAYLGITGEEPYYKKLAEEQVKIGEIMAKASGGLTVPVPGVGGAWLAGLGGPLSLKEPAVDAAYNAKVEDFKKQKQQNYESSRLTPRSRFSSLEYDDPILPTNAVRPGVAAATLGAMIGQTSAFGHPAAAATLAMTAPLAYEQRERVAVGLPLVLGGIPGPALLPTAVGGAAAYHLREPKPLPIEVWRPELIKVTVEKRAKVIAFGDQNPRNPNGEKGDLAKFGEEIEKLSEKGKAKDKGPVEKYIKEFIAARGLTHVGASTGLRDEWSIADDPELKTLVEAHKTARGFGYEPFGRSVFWRDQFDMSGRRAALATGLYAAEEYPQHAGDPGPGKPHYVIWRTAEEQPVKRNRENANADVIAAWKHLKAREKAKEYAETLANVIRANPAASEATIGQVLIQERNNILNFTADPKVRDRVRLFTLDNVAPLVLAPFGGPLSPFGLRESENIPYPTREMVTALIDNRDKPIKTVLVLPDAPKDVYYVAVLTRRDLKTPTEFKQDVYSQIGRAAELRDQFRAETVKKARQSVVDLLKKEFRFEATDEQKKKLEENAKSGGNTGD